MTVIDFTIKFTSNFRLATGMTGPRGADDGIVRRNGMPVVPGDRLGALVKDRCESIAALVGLRVCAGEAGGQKIHEGIPRSGLCDADGLPACALCRIFGAPGGRSAGYRFGEAAPLDRDTYWRTVTAASLEIALPHHRGQVITHVSIDSDKGRAIPRALYSAEEGARGMAFAGSAVEVPRAADEVERLQELGLLVSGLRWLRRAGASRNRGAGSCEIAITRISTDVLLAGAVANDWTALIRSFVDPPHAA